MNCSGVTPAFSAASMIGVPWVSSAQTNQVFVAPQAPGTHPDIGLDVAHQVAEVQRAVGVGQGGGDEGGAGHDACCDEAAVLGNVADYLLRREGNGFRSARREEDHSVAELPCYVPPTRYAGEAGADAAPMARLSTSDFSTHSHCG